MLFNTDEFVFMFLPATLLGYFLLFRFGHAKLSVAWIVAASLFYYGWWNPYYVLLVVGSILFNYVVGQFIHQARRGDRGKSVRALIGLGVVVNLGLLGYYKYANFFLDSLNTVLATDYHLGTIILPIGISFFTFQQIAYLVDAGQGEMEDSGFLEYCLFVLFFPQLVAGPIVHHSEMLPQFAKTETFVPSFSNFTAGGTIFIIGLFKKVVIADNFALVATPVFEAAEAGEFIDFAQTWEAVFAYSMQLYFDFSGYSDMAIGIARMFGVRLPLNFQSPYKATGIIDFWRRWHLTLSRFLRDYVYIPLGGSRRGRTRRFINLFLTMVIGGMWHGAGWNFLLWGALHGFYLVVNQGWRTLMGTPSDTIWARTAARLFTFIVVMLAWVPFRAETFAGAIDMYRGMATLPHTWQGPFGFLGDIFVAVGVSFEGRGFTDANMAGFFWMFVWLIIVWVMPNTQQIMARCEPAFAFDFDRQMAEIPDLLKRAKVLFWRPSPTWAVVVGLAFAASLVSMTKISEFLYYQF